MCLSPREQLDYMQKFEYSYQQQLNQIQRQAELVERSQRRITQVYKYLYLFVSLLTSLHTHLNCASSGLTCIEEDILYLMIVNMPSQVEMAAARQQLY